jgi:hypothetical protein
METARIGIRATLAILVAAVAFSAFLLRGDAAVGDTFATGGIDLKIDSKATYNGTKVPSATWKLKNLVPGSDYFFNFDDIKPGDYGENTISLHVKKQDAWMCIQFSNLQSDDNGQNEPEGLEDGNGDGEGELADGMEFFAWHDDGDNIFEKGEKPIFGTSTQAASDVLNDTTYPIGDSKNGKSCKVNETRYIGIFWCAGDLTVDVESATLSCDGSALGNAAQTDSLSVDISIHAQPVRDKPKFTCGEVSKPPKNPPHNPPKDDHDDDDGKGDEDDHDRDNDKDKPRFRFPSYPNIPSIPSFPSFGKFGSFFNNGSFWFK